MHATVNNTAAAMPYLRRLFEDLFAGAASPSPRINESVMVTMFALW